MVSDRRIVTVVDSRSCRLF